MPEPRQLEFLEKLAADRSDVQAAQLARARHALADAESKLQQLQRYESGYHTQLGARLAAPVEIDTLRGHHRFMQNVALAVRQQEIEVARRRANVDAVHRVWQETERRRQGFRVMAEKAVRIEHRNDERKLQKNNDEFAARNAQLNDSGP